MTKSAPAASKYLTDPGENSYRNMTSRSTYYTTYTIPAYYKYVPTYYKYTAAIYAHKNEYYYRLNLSRYEYNHVGASANNASGEFPLSWYITGYKGIAGSAYAGTWVTLYAPIQYTLSGTKSDSSSYSVSAVAYNFIMVDHDQSNGYYYYYTSVSIYARSVGSFDRCIIYVSSSYLTGDTPRISYYILSVPAYYAYTPAVYQYTAQKVYQPLLYRYQIV